MHEIHRPHQEREGRDLFGGSAVVGPKADIHHHRGSQQDRRTGKLPPRPDVDAANHDHRQQPLQHGDCQKRAAAQQKRRRDQRRVSGQDSETMELPESEGAARKSRAVFMYKQPSTVG